LLAQGFQQSLDVFVGGVHRANHPTTQQH